MYTPFTIWPVCHGLYKSLPATPMSSSCSSVRDQCAHKTGQETLTPSPDLLGYLCAGRGNCQKPSVSCVTNWVRGHYSQRPAQCTLVTLRRLINLEDLVETCCVLREAWGGLIPMDVRICAIPLQNSILALPLLTYPHLTCADVSAPYLR